MLAREFRNTAGDLCLRCAIPPPSYFAGARGGPNWRIGTPEECSALCHTIIVDVAARLAERYDLEAP